MVNWWRVPCSFYFGRCMFDVVCFKRSTGVSYIISAISMSMSRQTHTHSDMPVSESEYVRYDDKAWSLLSLEW